MADLPKISRIVNSAGSTLPAFARGVCSAPAAASVMRRDSLVIEGFRISSELKEMDLDAIHVYVSKSYWAKDIPIATLKRAMENSICFGVFDRVGDQVGFARAVTDYATYAYLADVYILDDHRGIGLSKWLMSEIMSHPRLQGLRRITLATRDAHGLYEKFGFKPLAKPEIFMEDWNPDVYKDA
jgi:GNAT superfamily N-acetyltransferase